MEDITTKTIIMAVNIFVTIMIVSLVLVSFYQMREVYSIVQKTDTSIYNQFDDVYTMYNGKVVSGVGLLNTIKRYEDNPDINILITYPGSVKVRESLTEKEREVVYLKNLMEQGIDYKYETKYNVTVYENSENNLVINFDEIVY